MGDLSRRKSMLPDHRNNKIGYTRKQSPCFIELSLKTVEPSVRIPLPRALEMSATLQKRSWIMKSVFTNHEKGYMATQSIADLNLYRLTNSLRGS